MGNRDPGMRHLISRSLASTDPLIGVRIFRIGHSIVEPGSQNDSGLGRNQWLMPILIGIAVVPTRVPVRGLAKGFAASGLRVEDSHGHRHTT